MDGHIRCIVRIKCSNNNKGVTYYRFLEEAVTNHVVPLQAYGNKES